MKFKMKYLLLVFLAFVIFLSCSKQEEEQLLKNDLLKKTTSPAIVGQPLEFAYALGTLEGKVKSAKAEASLAGATGTGFELYSWYTNRTNGVDQPVLTVNESTTDGAVSTATLMDTNAVTLRYKYIIPEDARGKEVSFTFTGTSTTDRVVSAQSPSVKISKMDMKRLINLADGGKCYVSIADMAAYTKLEVEAQNLSAKIDFVYIYRATISGYTFGHAFVALDNAQFTTDLAIPATWTKQATLLDKRIDIYDMQLKAAIPMKYIDDIDLEKTTVTNWVNYAYGFSANHGAFVRTADGTYMAYVYVNALNNTAKTMTISIKSLKLN